MTEEELRKVLASATHKVVPVDYEPALKKKVPLSKDYLPHGTPTAIVDALYRQNIKNYNPYTTALQVLETENELTGWEKEKVRRLCHIGVAKEYLKNKVHSQVPSYSPVNVLIRTYMRDKMEQCMREKESSEDSVVFVPTTPLALSFNPNEFPPALAKVLPHAAYSQVIQQVNLIIEQEYLRVKGSSIVRREETLTGKLLLGAVALLLVGYVATGNSYCLVGVFVALLLWIGCSLWEGKQLLEQLSQAKDSTTTIKKRITAFFKEINTERVDWRVGEDFYWLEVHYIKRKPPT